MDDSTDTNPPTQNVTDNSQPGGDLWSEIEEFTLNNPIIIPPSQSDYSVPNWRNSYNSGISTSQCLTATGDFVVSPQNQQSHKPEGLRRKRYPTPYERDFLEKTFKEIKYPDGHDIECFSLLTYLSKRQIMQWFQRRRTKWCKEQRESSTNTPSYGWDFMRTKRNSLPFPETMVGAPDAVEGVGLSTQDCSACGPRRKNSMTPK